MKTPLCILICCVIAVASEFSEVNEIIAADEAVDFRRDVAPILQRRCLTCHNDHHRRGGLSLHSAKAVAKGGDSGQVVLSGKPDSSYLLDLVTPSDGTAEMPKGATPLKAEEVATLRRWITDGATWPADAQLKPPTHWSLKALTRPVVRVRVSVRAVGHRAL